VKLQDINLALTNLTRIHEGLSEEKLNMLLSAAGWEKKDIDDAVLMWKNGEIGKEITERIEEEKKEEVSKSPDVNKTPANTAETVKVDPSLKKEEKIPNPEDHLPHNLPLRPYESSFVTVPFSDYRKRFTSPVITESRENLPPKKIAEEQINISKPSYEEEKISSPLHSEDKVLVLIASSLFLVLMILLGYMYSNGRL